MAEELLVVKSNQDLDKLKMQNISKEIVTYLIPAVIVDCGEFELLAELVRGGIVVDIDTSRIVDFISLEELSMNELNVLEQGMMLGKFTANDIKTELNYFRLEAMFLDLIKRELLTLEDNKYKVSDRVQFVYHPEDYATDVIPETIEVEGKKLDAKTTVHAVKDRINRIAKVNNYKECWILYYKAK